MLAKQRDDLDDQLDADLGEEGPVVTGLDVLDDAVGDGQTDVPLPAGVVRAARLPSAD